MSVTCIQCWTPTQTVWWCHVVVTFYLKKKKESGLIKAIIAILGSFRLLLQCVCVLCSSGILHNIGWWLVTDAVRPFKMGPTGCPKSLVTNLQQVQSNIPEEWQPEYLIIEAKFPKQCQYHAAKNLYGKSTHWVGVIIWWKNTAHEDDLWGEINVRFNAYSEMDAGCWNSIVSILTMLWTGV